MCKTSDDQGKEQILGPTGHVSKLLLKLQGTSQMLHFEEICFKQGMTEFEPYRHLNSGVLSTCEIYYLETRVGQDFDF